MKGILINWTFSILVLLSAYMIGHASASYSNSYHTQSSYYYYSAYDYRCVNEATNEAFDSLLELPTQLQLSEYEYCEFNVTAANSLSIAVNDIHFYNSVSSYFYVSHSPVCNKSHTFIFTL